jgi:hypothetical protein
MAQLPGRKKQKALSSTPTAPVSKKAQEGGECKKKQRGEGESGGRRPGFFLMFYGENIYLRTPLNSNLKSHSENIDLN